MNIRDKKDRKKQLQEGDLLIGPLHLGKKNDMSKYEKEMKVIEDMYEEEKEYFRK